MARIETCRTPEAIFQAQCDAELIGTAVFFPAKRKLIVVRLGSKTLVPIDGGDEVMCLGGGHAGGVHAGDEASHAGARDDVDRDAVLFEPLDDSDVGEAARATAAEDQGNFGARLSGLLGAGGETGSKKQQKRRNYPGAFAGEKRHRNLSRTEKCKQENAVFGNYLEGSRSGRVDYITGGTGMPRKPSTRISSRRTTAAVASRNCFRLASSSARMGWWW